MSVPPIQLAAIVRRCLAYHIKTNPPVCLPLEVDAARRELVQLARHNFASGRYERFRNHPRAPTPLTPMRYVKHLVEMWVREADFYYRLCENDPVCWTELRQLLIHTAAGALGKFPSGETAEDCAQRACAQIFIADYPFDVPFFWWASTIVQNLVFARGRSKDRFNDRVTSLDAPLHSESHEISATWQIADPVTEFFTEAIHDRDLLRRSLRRLNEQRRTIIVLSYIEEWDDLLIGKTLGIKAANVQTLRHRALDQLAELLGGNPMTENRSRRHRIDKKKATPRKNHEARVAKK